MAVLKARMKMIASANTNQPIILSILEADIAI